MVALVTLLQAVQNDARAEIDAFLEALKQETANARLAELSTTYTFKTFWDGEAFEGNRVMLAQDLAQVMYDTKNIAGLGTLLRRYGLDLYGLGTSKHDLWKYIKTYFNLSRHTNQVAFATYQHLLMAGMKGETEFARKVCAYVLAMEEKARVSEALDQQPQRSPVELLRDVVLDHDKRLECVEKKVHDTNVIAINAQTNILRLHEVVVIEKQARLHRAQSYLPGEYNARMRSRIFEFAAYHCLRCGVWMTLEDELPTSCEIDEVYPRGQGGNRAWDTIQALCRKCNGLKKDAQQRGEWMGQWDFRTPIFHAACDREQRKYEHRMRSKEAPLPLFPVMEKAW